MKSYALDDEKEYYIIMERKINDIEYILFSEINNPSNICFRKRAINKDGVRGFIRLSSEDEFNQISLEFFKSIL